MVFGSVAINFKCTFLRGIECFLLRTNISNLAEATREKRFTTMTPLGMSRDATCLRLWRHNCFSNSTQFELIYFISIWTSQNLLKMCTFLCIRKRNKLFDHPSYHSFKSCTGTLSWTGNMLFRKCNNTFALVNKYMYVSRNVVLFMCICRW